ncbi:amidohydrolase family protein [Elongatibacter sediminis]|uniref:Amidohydrolase family protein n=1 Tax=Elongatibacter sediminis TaxID=3119006 RepID=A0AAW9RE39_9GAMM
MPKSEMRLSAPLRTRAFTACASALLAGFSAVSASADLLIENVTLIDGTGRAPVAGATVLVEDDRITRVGRDAVDAPRGVDRIDGEGKYLIPGLMDVHIHLRGAVRVAKDGFVEDDHDVRLGEQALQGFLYSGVTTVYDVGNVPDYIFSLRERERSGELISTRLLATGGIVTYPGSHGSDHGATLIDDWPEATVALQAHADRQPDMVKFTLEERGWGARPLIPLLPVDLLQHSIEFFNERGIRTTAHTSSEWRARQAIYAGIDTLAHPVIQGPITDAFAKLMGAKKIPMTTTLTIGENYSRLAEHPEYLDQPLYQAVLDAEEIRTLQEETAAKYRAETWTWWMKLMSPVAAENLRKIHEAGGVLALGTDQSSGPAVHREMELLAAAGIPPLEVIRIATLNSATFLGRADDMGSIEEGKIADLVLLDADPSADIDNAKQIRQVIKAGEVIDRSALNLPVNR